MQIDFAFINQQLKWLLWYSHTERLHKTIVASLLKGDSAFNKTDINTNTRTVHMGFYSLKTVVLNSKDGFLLWLLWNFYNYKFAETRIEFPSFTKATTP